MKIDVEKLRAILAEQGMSEEQIEAIIAQASEETPNVPEGEGEEPSTSGEDVPPVEETPSDDPVVPEGEAEGVPPQDEVPPEAESVPPVPEELPPEVPPTELPPVEEQPGEVPPEPAPEILPPEPQGVPLEEYMQVKNELEEQKKATEGLAARVDALTEALKAAGVIDASVSSEVGIDQPSAPGNSEVDTTMDDVLREINRKGY